MFPKYNGTYVNDRGRIRTIDENGNVLTLMGQSFEYGDQGQALDARLGNITSFNLWKDSGNDKLIVFDTITEKLLTFISNLFSPTLILLHPYHNFGDSKFVSKIVY